MNQKRWLILGLALASLAQLAVPAWMIAQREITLRQGELFKFRTQPIDPADPFRGRYVAIALQPSEVKVENPGAWDRRQAAYAVLAHDEEGYAKVVRLEKEPPGSEPSIKVRVQWPNRDTASTVQFRWPIDRFYMEETKAPEAERAYREHSRRGGEADCHVTVRVRGGSAVVENLFIDDRPIREYLRDAE